MRQGVCWRALGKNSNAARGGAQSPAVQQAASQLLGLAVLVPAPGEYVANGAARQAAGVLTGAFPTWQLNAPTVPAHDPAPEILTRYRLMASTLAVHSD